MQLTYRKGTKLSALETNSEKRRPPIINLRHEVEAFVWKLHVPSQCVMKGLKIRALPKISTFLRRSNIPPLQLAKVWFCCIWR